MSGSARCLFDHFLRSAERTGECGRASTAGCVEASLNPIRGKIESSEGHIGVVLHQTKEEGCHCERAGTKVRVALQPRRKMVESVILREPQRGCAYERERIAELRDSCRPIMVDYPSGVKC